MDDREGARFRIVAPTPPDEHVWELNLSDSAWIRIQEGKPVSVRGEGFRHEGKFYWTYWDFEGGLTGDVVIRSDAPFDPRWSNGEVRVKVLDVWN